MNGRPTVLFAGESGSLAHVARLLVLAGALDPSRFRRFLATDGRFRELARTVDQLQFLELRGTAPELFAGASAHGGHVPTVPELLAAVDAERRLLETVRPDLVVNDFRHTLPIAAALVGIPCLAVTNAHWSPFRDLGFDPLVPRPHTGDAPPAPSRSATATFNEVRVHFGLPPVSNYLELCTSGDAAVYVDPPGWVPLQGCPSSHWCVGPVVWSPQSAMPRWWDALPDDRPVIYLTLGSTGLAPRLPAMLEALAALPVTVLAATAGRVRIPLAPDNARVADFLPGAACSRRAAVVICNGGSGTAYQALAEGTPVLGLWSNIDQFLTSKLAERHGVGVAMAAHDASPTDVTDALAYILQTARLRDGARDAARWFQATSVSEEFTRAVCSVLARS